MHSSTSRLSRRARLLGVAAAGLTVAAGVAACGSSSSAGATPAAATSSAAAGAPGGATRQRVPGTTGLVAAISGTTLQVQGSSSQTAVAYTSSTAFTERSTLTLAKLTTGECATVTGTTSGATFTARSIRVDPASSAGTCTAAAGGRAGGFGFGGGTRPSGAPGGGFGGPEGGGTPPSGAAGRAAVSFLTGKITAVSATGLTVAGTVATRTPESPAASPATGGSTTVATAGSTSITADAATTASALKVGVCVTAVGSTASSGQVTARTISISAPVDGSCTSGFGGGFGGRGGAAGSGS